MNENLTHTENISQSPLYSEDLAPIANGLAIISEAISIADGYCC